MHTYFAHYTISDTPIYLKALISVSKLLKPYCHILDLHEIQPKLHLNARYGNPGKSPIHLHLSFCECFFSNIKETLNSK